MKCGHVVYADGMYAYYVEGALTNTTFSLFIHRYTLSPSTTYGGGGARIHTWEITMGRYFEFTSGENLTTSVP